MSTYDFMRVIVFFDLPVSNNKEKKAYRVFRRFLIKNGHIMIQYSVYSKILNNRDAAENHIVMIRKNAPKKGHLRLMMVTEKQYASMRIILGGKTYSEQKLTIDPFVEF